MRASLLFWLLTAFSGALVVFPTKSLPQSSAEEKAPAGQRILYIPGTHFGIKEGLPSPNTNGITQTPDKVLWISTEEGLVRYDGVDFSTIQRGDVTGQDFPTNTLNTVWAASTGELWLAFSNTGVGVLNPITRQLRLFPVRGQGPHALMGDDVWHFAQDSSGRIWMMEYGEGFSVWNPAHQSMQHIAAKTTDKTSWLSSNQLFDFFIDEDDILWAVTLDSQVIRHDLATATTLTFDLKTDASDPFSNPMYTIRRVHGAIYAAGYDGLFVYEPDQQRFRQLLQRSDLERLTGQGQSLMTLAESRSGGIWIGSTNGLFYWNHGQIAPVSLFEFGQLLPLKDTVMAIYTDHQSGIWVLTDSNGVFKLANNWDQFTYFLPFTEEDRLSGNHIRSVAKTPRHSFWLAYIKGGRLDEVKLDSTGFTPLRHSRNNPEVPSRPISLYYDTNNNLWLGSLDGLYMLRPEKSAKTQRLRLPEGLAKAPLVGRIPSLQQHQQRLWLTVFDAEHPAYVNLDESPKKIHPFFAVTFNPRDGEQRFLPAASTESNRLWLLSPTRLSEMDTVTGALTPLLINQPSIQDLSFAPDGQRVWVLINGRLKAYHWEKGQLRPAEQENPMAVNSSTEPHTDVGQPFYTHVVEDKQGNLWLGSNVGLLHIHLPSGKTRFYTEAEGLPSREIFDLQLTDEGQALIVTKWGLVTPNPSYRPVISHKPPLIVRGLYHGEQPLPVHQPVTLPHDYGLLRLEYALLAFNNPKSIEYFYRLHPQQPWMRADGPQLSLMQLPPDQYQLQVKGITSSGQESDIITVSVTVLPPPWLSPGAFTLYAALAVIVLGLSAWFWRRKVNRDFALRQANEKREFAENQLALTRSLVSTLDFDKVLHRVVEQIQQRVRADNALLLLWNTKNDQPIVATSSGIKPTDKALRALQAMHPAMHSQQTQKITLQENAVLQTTQNNEHALVVPFSSTSHGFGLLMLSRKKRPFSERHKALLQAYAAQASVALENARLFSEVQRLAKEANAASQAKSDFLARVSHEVRTPMNGVLGMTELLLDSPLNEEQKLYAEAIQSSGEHLLGIINDILDLSKIEAGKLQLETTDFDLQELLDDVLQLFAPQARKNRIALYYLLDVNVPRCRHGDALRLKQILFNLLSNAIKFTRRGHISIQISPQKDNPNGVQFRIEDSGIGIRNDTAKTLFEPFVQADNATSRKYGGTGLGLAIARQLVEKMHGRIQAQGTPGKGSCFTFFVHLPICQTQHPRPPCPEGQVAVLTTSSHLQTHLNNLLTLCGLQQTHDISRADWVLVDAGHPLTASQKSAVRQIDPKNTRVLALIYEIEDMQGLKNWLPPDARPVLLPLTTRGLCQALQAQDADDAREPAATESAPVTNAIQAKVLVVEDNPINHQVATEMLEKSGFLVDVVESGEEALARVASENYDIILTDYHLPDLNGIDMAQQLVRRQLQCNQEPTPVVLVTADLTDNTWQKAAAAGIRSLVPKPFTQKELVTAIRQALDHT